MQAWSERGARGTCRRSVARGFWPRVLLLALLCACSVAEVSPTSTIRADVDAHPQFRAAVSQELEDQASALESELPELTTKDPVKRVLIQSLSTSRRNKKHRPY